MINSNLGVSVTSAVGHGLGGDLKCATATFTVTAALTAAQILPMLAVPAGARIVDAKISLDTLPGGKFSLGDVADPARFISTADPGARLTKGDLYLYKKSTVLSVRVDTVPTGAAGAIKLAVFYVVDGVSPQD